MRSIALVFIIALIIAISGIGALAADTRAPATTVKNVPIGTKKATKVTLGKSFRKAHESFAKKDIKSAVAEIRKDAEFIKSISERTIDASREPLMASSRDLETLADAIEKGTVTSAKDLEDAFSNASKALARHYSLKANESLANKDGKKLGKDLKATADYLEASFTWAGTKPDKGVDTVIKKVRGFAKEITNGKDLQSEETSKNIKNISAEIEKIIAKANKEAAKPTKTEPVKKT